MTSRIAPTRGQGPLSGRGRGRGAGRGVIRVGNPSIAEHVNTIGVRRPGFGTAGRPINTLLNMFEMSIPENLIFHYDVITPDKLPIRMNHEIIKILQNDVAPSIFSPRASYDGRKNLYSTSKLALGSTDSAEFDVMIAQPGGGSSIRPPKVYKIRLTKVAEINPEIASRFMEGKQEQDNAVQTTLTALNVVIRMAPSQTYPFNSRSFFTDSEKRSIGAGIELWRGYFQAVHPSARGLLLNVDITTGMMYKSGSLISLCLDFLGKSDVRILSPKHGFPDRQRMRLQRFLLNVRVTTKHTGRTVVRSIKALSDRGANDLQFSTPEGNTLTVANYFESQLNRPLQYPDLVCVKFGSGALIPLELCEVPPGQIIKKQAPTEKTKEIVEFSTMNPKQRFASITRGMQVLSHGQSEYIRAFGISISNTGPISNPARIIAPPTLHYGEGSKQKSIMPANGQWNMLDKRFVKPTTIENWFIIVYESESRFNMKTAKDMVKSILQESRKVGIRILDENPLIKWQNAQGSIDAQLRAAGSEVVKEKKKGPNLIMVVLPNDAGHVYHSVKHFGDISIGVATQCLRAMKCSNARPQYWANVMLKLNAKMGGINVVPDPSSVSPLTDPKFPTIIMGADVIHPPPGAQEKPSFTAVVGSVDSGASRYVSKIEIQTSGQEMIDDMQSMSKHILQKYLSYRKEVEMRADNKPKRLIFYRDGVSEGQFKQVLEIELPQIQAACRELDISPKITLIIVRKRHHIRMRPENDKDADRSGNCPAGTVLDDGIGHPLEFDFLLQSHGGLLGTSRGALYNILHDENNFSADAIQSLSFALCHVYARCTRSVSIPTPVYYADIVCSRAKLHYNPSGGFDLSDTGLSQGDDTIQAFKDAFKPLHKAHEGRMHFM